MRSLLHLAFRFWTHQRVQYRLSLISSTLAVAFLTVLVILSATWREGLYQRITDRFGFHDIRVQSLPGKVIEPDDVALATQIQGVVEVTPALSLSGLEVPGEERYLTYSGVSQEQMSRAAHLLVEGSYPAPGEVALPRPYAKARQVTIGDHLELPFGSGTSKRVTVSGLTEGVPGSLRGGTVLFDLTWLQETFGYKGRFNGLLIRTADPASLGAGSRVATELKQAYPQAEVDEMKDLRDARRSAQKFFSFATSLGLFALLSTIFLISGNYLIGLRDRTQQLGALRAMGASRNTVIRLVLFEALPPALISSLLGVVLGALAALLTVKGAFSLLGGQAKPTPIPWVTLTFPLLWCSLGGLLTNLIAALFPAVRASLVSPVAALSGRPLAARRIRFGSLVGLALAILGAIGIIATGLRNFTPDEAEKQALIVAASGLVMVLGFTAGLPRILPLVIRGLAPFMARRREELSLAARNTVRYVGQSRFMFGSLSVGAIICLFILSYVSLSRIEMEQLIGDRIMAPFMLSSRGRLAISPEMMEQVRSLPGVTEVSEITISVPTRLTGYDFARADQDWYRVETKRIETAESLGFPISRYPGEVDVAALDKAVSNFRTVAGRAHVDVLARGGALLPRRWAENLGLKPGDTFQLEVGRGTSARTVSLTVAALYERGPFAGDTILIDRKIAENSLGVTEVQHLLVYAPSDAEAQNRLESLQVQFPHVRLQNRDAALTEMRRGLMQTMALVLAAVIVILVGSAASLVTVIATILNERRREFGQMRAAGATARQVVRLVSLEVTLICMGSAVLALLIGGLVTWGLLRLMDASSPLPSPSAAVVLLVAFSLLSWAVVRKNIRPLDDTSVISALMGE